jgi:hypothetical protein
MRPDAQYFLEQVIVNELAWMITARAGGTVVGITGNAEERTAEPGSCLRRRFWGQGFATEAAALAVKFALRPSHDLDSTRESIAGQHEFVAHGPAPSALRYGVYFRCGFHLNVATLRPNLSVLQGQSRVSD